MPEYDATVHYADVPGFPGYRVGTDGTVWSCWKRGNRPVVMGDWKELKPTPVECGYRRINIYRNGERFHYQLHTLILETFVGPCSDGMVCRHFPDRNPANNRLDNLQWGTEVENNADRVVHGTTNRGERCGTAKLTSDDVRDIRRRRGLGESLKSLSLEYGISQGHISELASRKKWAHLV